MDKTTTVGAYTDAALLELAQRTGELISLIDDVYDHYAGLSDGDRARWHMLWETVGDVRAFLVSIRGLGFLG